MIKWSLLSLYTLYFLFVFVFYKTSIGDLTSLDIVIPSPDDGSLEPKHYSIDFFFIIKLFFLDYLVYQFFFLSLDIYISVISKKENSTDKFYAIIDLFQLDTKDILPHQMANIQCKERNTNIFYLGGGGGIIFKMKYLTHSCRNESVLYLFLSIFTNPPPLGQDMTQGQFLSEV